MGKELFDHSTKAVILPVFQEAVDSLQNRGIHASITPGGGNVRWAFSLNMLHEKAKLEMIVSFTERASQLEIMSNNKLLYVETLSTGREITREFVMKMVERELSALGIQSPWTWSSGQ